MFYKQHLSYKQQSKRLVMFLEKISNKSSLSQKVKQQSIIAKQQKLVIFLINLSNLVKIKNIF